MFIVNITTIYSLGHGLHTLTAVPRSTQPSTLRGDSSHGSFHERRPASSNQVKRRKSAMRGKGLGGGAVALVGLIGHENAVAKRLWPVRALRAEGELCA